MALKTIPKYMLWRNLSFLALFDQFRQSSEHEIFIFSPKYGMLHVLKGKVSRDHNSSKKWSYQKMILAKVSENFA